MGDIKQRAGGRNLQVQTLSQHTSEHLGNGHRDCEVTQVLGCSCQQLNGLDRLVQSAGMDRADYLLKSCPLDPVEVVGT